MTLSFRLIIHIYIYIYIYGEILDFGKYVFNETRHAWTLPHLSLPFIFIFSFWNLSPHIYLFLTEINLPLSGQISDETWYT